jgi:hypothetical protein
MNKPTIFISHIAEEKEIAITLKNFITNKFLSFVNVFVSSDEESIQLGNDWLSIIKHSMLESSITIVICSPISIFRPWINFEAGAGWMKDNPVIPFCHSGLIPGNLPLPLKSFQGGQLNQEEDLKKLFKIIANKIDSDIPEIEDSDFISSVMAFETKIQNSLLVKDTSFIQNLIERQILLLEYCIYSSTTEYDTPDYFELKEFKISDYEFTLKSIKNIFNNTSSILGYDEKIYETYYKTINQFIDNVKFILTYNNINIPYNLRALFNNLLESSIINSDWYYSVYTIDHNEPIKDSIIQQFNEDTEEHEYNTGSFINVLKLYHVSLLFYKQWITFFKEETQKILQ